MMQQRSKHPTPRLKDSHTYGLLDNLPNIKHYIQCAKLDPIRELSSMNRSNVSSPMAVVVPN